MSGVWRIFAVAAVSTLALSGCSSDGVMPSSWFDPGSRSPPNPSLDHRPTQESDKIVKLPVRPEDVDCPQVEVAEGGASARVGGEASQDVRYQFNISDVSRECDPKGAQFALKVGVALVLLVGPAGSPGAYSTTVHLEVKRPQDGKSLFSKSYNVSMNTNGGDRASYSLVTEPILFPLTRARLDDDYSIVVGLGGTSGAAATTRHKHHRQG
jgi:hypothetical protein